MFVCSTCGARMTSCQPARRGRKRYLCGTAHYRGNSYCKAKPVDKRWIETFLLRRIQEIFGTKETAVEIAERINKEALGENTSFLKEKSKLEKQLNIVESKITNLVRAVSNGFDFEAAKTEIDSLKNEKVELEAELRIVRSKDNKKPKPVSAEDIIQLYERLEEAFQTENTEQRRKLLRCFVKRLEYNSKTDSLKVYIFSQPIESACIMAGAQDRT